MGSFFSNPLQDTFVGEDGKIWENVWPDALPDFKDAIKDLSFTMKSTSHLFANHLGTYARTLLPSFEQNYFSEIIQKAAKVTSRLVHYYPCENDFNGQWAGWHKDLGMLTFLTPALYTDSVGNEINWCD